MFANYYVFDALAPVSSFLTDKKGPLGFTDEQYGALFTAYNIGALVALLLAGPIIDRIGAKRAVLIFGLLAAAAGFLTAFSPNYNVMWASRCLLGIGSEPLIVAITTALAKWFKGKELSFAFSINLVIARLGSVAADNSPTWAKALFTGWQPPLMLAAGVGILVVIGGVLYLAIESHAERTYSLGREGSTDKLKLKEMIGFSPSYWFVVALCLTFYSAIFPFRSFAFKFFTEGKGTSLETAGLHAHSSCRSDRHDRDRVLPHPGDSLAVGGLHRRGAPPGHGLRPHDALAAGGLGGDELAHRMVQRPLGRERPEPQGLHAGHVDLLYAGLHRAPLFLPAAEERDRPQRPRPRDHQSHGEVISRHRTGRLSDHRRSSFQRSCWIRTSHTPVAG
jgi:hypothetical protein